jgi:protein-tyrosine-phosphatase
VREQFRELSCAAPQEGSHRESRACCDHGPAAPRLHRPAYLLIMRILFVCTGNTCRSPLAEALLKEALAGRGIDSVTVSSAGTGAWDGAPASEGSYLVALEQGLDLSEHRARMLTRELVREADLILVMSGHHLARVEELGGGEKVHLLTSYAGRDSGSNEVNDPFGSDLASYRATVTELQELIGGVVSRVAGTVR